MRLFQRIHQKLNWSVRRYMGILALIILITYVISAVYQVYKPLPEGLDYQSESYPAKVEFLSDRTFMDAQGKVQSEQQIFDAILTLIDQAQSTIVLDMFLFNAELGQSKLEHRALTNELTNALIQKKLLNPQIEIKLITDPINTIYGGVDAEHLRQLNNGGIDVIVTDLTRLRASNPIWSGFWYMCCQSLGNNTQGGWLPHPLGSEKVTLRSYLQLFNFKANHRKTIVVDTLDGWKALITSANPHDASSQHSNVAMIVHGKVAIAVLDSERAVAKMSGGDTSMVIMADPPKDSNLSQVQVITEKAIHRNILEAIDQLQSGDQLDLLMFYLSERNIINAMKQAHLRGVKVRVALDPNKDAFGLDKNGIPNRQVAWELHKVGVDVRWCNTHGEQCHGKMLIATKADGTSQVILGSANFTARNLKNYNLETNISVLGSSQYSAIVQAQQYFESVWRYDEGRHMSVDYNLYKDESWFKYWLYRFMEWSGLSTF